MWIEAYEIVALAEKEKRLACPKSVLICNSQSSETIAMMWTQVGRSASQGGVEEGKIRLGERVQNVTHCTEYSWAQVSSTV